MLAVCVAACSGPAAPAGGGGRGDLPDAARAAASVAAEPPAPGPTPAPTVAADVPPGTVAVPVGPFTDRLRFDHLELAATAVTGTVDIVSDVSELIALELRVDFYDKAGVLLGSAQQTFGTADAEPFHTTAGVVGLPFTVPAPAGTATSAVVSVPVLVNE